MAFSDYNVTPDANVSIGGISIAENCPPGNLNGAIRVFMSDARALSDSLPVTSNLMPKAAGVFSGAQPTYAGRGAFLHHNTAAFTSGRIFAQASGGSTPSGMLPGDWLAEY